MGVVKVKTHVLDPHKTDNMNSARDPKPNPENSQFVDWVRKVKGFPFFRFEPWIPK